MSEQDYFTGAKNSKQKQSNNEITDEMAMDYAIFLYSLYRNAKTNYNNMKGNNEKSRKNHPKL